MEKQTKILVGVLAPLAVFGFYWFVYRKREPFLNLNKTDFKENKAIATFGNTTKVIPLGSVGYISAGKTYEPNRYEVSYNSDVKKKKINFYVMDYNLNLVDAQTVDFGAKIIY